MSTAENKDRISPVLAFDDSTNKASTVAEQRFVTTNGSRIVYQHIGTGPPLVLVHGLLGYSFSWRKVLPLLANHFEVFAPDMPGSGFSACDASLDCRLRASAERLIAFMDAVGITSCNLLGTSYGGATAMMTGAVAPARLRRLVLVAPANPWSKHGRKRIGLLQIPALAAVFPAVARKFGFPLQRLALRRMYGEPSQLTREAAEGYSKALTRKGPFEHAVQITRTWHADMAELQSLLPLSAQLPTLVIWGTKDRVVDPASGQQLISHLHSARLELMDGAGHLPYEEAPEDFVRRVADFLLLPSGSYRPGHP